MKKFEELSDLEIYNLSDEQIETYKKVELAEHGIIFPVAPVEPQLEDELKPDKVVFYIPLASTSLAFENIEDANNVLQALQNANTAGQLGEFGVPKFTRGFGNDYMGQKLFLSVAQKEVYSKEVYEQNNAIRQRNSKLRSTYEEAKGIFDELMQRVEKQLTPMCKRIEDARYNIQKKMRLTHTFVNDYMPLAENNIETAMRYMKLAYSISESDEAYIRENC